MVSNCYAVHIRHEVSRERDPGEVTSLAGLSCLWLAAEVGVRGDRVRGDRVRGDRVRGADLLGQSSGQPGLQSPPSTR